MDAYFNRGIVKGKLKDSKGALQDFNRAIELNPKKANAYLSRGLAKIVIGDKNGGCLDFSKAGELGNVSAYDLIKKYCN